MSDRTKRPDPLAQALAALPTPPLNARVAERVRRQALSELAPAAPAAPVRWRLVLSGAVVPGLLLTTAVARTVQTVNKARQIFATDETPDHGEGDGRE